MHPNVKSLIGKTFGRLLVVGTAPRPEGSKGRGQHWECICECLESVVVRSDSLVQGKSTCCGCSSPQTALMRSYIRPRHPKSTVSVHATQPRTKSIPETHLDMTGNQSTYSDTIGVSLADLVSMRDSFAALDLSKMTAASYAAIEWLELRIDTKSARLTPIVSEYVL